MAERFASKNRYKKRPNSHPGRIELIRKDFENLIEDQGARVRVTPSILCPNRTSLGDTNHVLNCQICGGDEAVDLPEQAVEVWAFIQGMKLDKQFQVQGIWDLKDAMISMMPEVRLYYWYKIEIIDFASVYNQLILRGPSDSDKDRLRYSPAKVTTDTPYLIIDSAGNNYKLGKHYKIVDQDIEWRTVDRPEAGKLYSFAYPVLPTFRVLEMLHENRYYFESFKRPDKVPVQMPQQAVIRWDYLAKGEGSNNPLLETV